MTRRGDRQTFRNEDLVLKVSTNIDPSVWDETKYDPFLDELCRDREYQKTAIRTTLRYLLGGKYKNLKQLARENFDSNDELKQRYGSWSSMERHLQLPDQLSCSVDLATGTGKSYVLYGIAAILLAEGAVDKVLLLCPSNTIEAGLLEKFKECAGDADLRDLLPADSKVMTPRIITATESLVDGCICIENYHAILERVRSSIKDSLTGQGARVAVLCDEAHHVASEPAATVKKWKEFLLSPDFGFRLVVGVSGTCYVADEYFSDVIARFSLREGIEQRFVKQVRYVAEMPTTDGPDEKWQLIFKQHQEAKKQLKRRNIRPLSIIVTREISLCNRVAEELSELLREWESLTPEAAQDKVLVVTSHRDHQPNLAKLRTVDSPSSPVEWIVSVSMLSEGWDVKNVFQIVPHEERAFNSKLLIAQVLGRGLRKPEPWTGAEPVVTVFNHDAWSSRISHLVNEILEIERRISANVIEGSQYNFDLHTLDYERLEDTTEFTKKGEYRLFQDGYVDLPTQPISESVEIEFETALTGERQIFRTRIEHKSYSVEDIARQMYGRLQSIDEESRDAEDPADRTSYAQKYPLEQCEKVILESLKRASSKHGRITEDNRQRLLQSLGTLRRKKAKRVLYKLNPKALVTLNTAQRHTDSCAAAEIRRNDKTIFYSPDTDQNIADEQVEFFTEIKDQDGEFRGGRELIANSFDFKTPMNFVIADATPERKFIRNLCARPVSLVIESWIKNTNQRFYAIEYAYRRRDHTKRGEFSPDFFIKQDNVIFVIEVKGDEEIADPAPENLKKMEYAAKHFNLLNARLEAEGNGTRYQFNFLSPKDYSRFFELLTKKELNGFKSKLDIALTDAANEE